MNTLGGLRFADKNGIKNERLLSRNARAAQAALVVLIAPKRPSNSVVDLRPHLLKLLAHLPHALLHQLGPLGHQLVGRGRCSRLSRLLFLRQLAQLLRDLHAAELGPAHAAEVRGLRQGGQGCGGWGMLGWGRTNARGGGSRLVYCCEGGCMPCAPAQPQCSPCNSAKCHSDRSGEAAAALPHLGGLLWQRGIVEGACGHRVQAEVELVLPARPWAAKRKGQLGGQDGGGGRVHSSWYEGNACSAAAAPPVCVTCYDRVLYSRRDRAIKPALQSKNHGDASG